MTYNELDCVLRKLEPQEELLLNHIIPHPDYSALPRKTVEGKSFLYMKNEASQTFPNRPHPFVSVHKNFRFTNMPPHIHDGVEISYIYSGNCTMTIGNTSYTMTKGQFLLMDTNIPHSIDSVGQMNDLLVSVLIEPRFFQNAVFHHLATGNIISDFLSNTISIHSSHNSFILFHSENSRRLAYYMNELMIEHLDSTINGADVVTHLLQLIFLELMGLYAKDDSICSNMPDSSFSSFNVIPILDYINSNYQNCTLKSTAEYFNIHPSYLTTLLKRNTGFSFRELTQKQRFTNAITLLENTDTPVEQIAAQVGYDTTTYFYKKFRSFYGCSPKEYRSRNKRKQQ